MCQEYDKLYNKPIKPIKNVPLDLPTKALNIHWVLCASHNAKCFLYTYSTAFVSVLCTATWLGAIMHIYRLQYGNEKWNSDLTPETELLSTMSCCLPYTK